MFGVSSSQPSQVTGAAAAAAVRGVEISPVEQQPLSPSAATRVALGILTPPLDEANDVVMVHVPTPATVVQKPNLEQKQDGPAEPTPVLRERSGSLCLPGFRFPSIRPRGGSVPAISIEATARPLSDRPFRILDAYGADQDWYLSPLSFSNKLGVGALATAKVIATRNINTKQELSYTNHYNSYQASAWIGDALIGAGKSLDAGFAELYTFSPAAMLLAQSYKSKGSDPVVARHFGGPSNCFALGFRDGSLQIFDIRSKSHVLGLPAHKEELCGLTVSQNGTTLATGSNDGQLKLWDMRSGAVMPLSTFADSKSAIKALAWHPTEPSILAYGAGSSDRKSGSSDRKVKILDTSANKVIKSFQTESQVSGLEWISKNTLVMAHGYLGSNLLSTYRFNPSFTRFERGHFIAKQDEELRALSMVSGPRDEKMSEIWVLCNNEQILCYDVQAALGVK